MVGSIPLVGGFLSLGDVSSWLIGLKGIDQTMSTYQKLWDNIEGALRHIGFPKFRMYWRVGRLLVSLPTRLLVEEVLTYMGRPWSDLKTGFDTISSVDEKNRLRKAVKAGIRLNIQEASRWKALKARKKKQSNAYYRPGGM